MDARTSLEELLQREGITTDDVVLLDAVCRKVDVVGRVFVAYKDGWSRRAASTEISAQDYLMLGECLFRLAGSSKLAGHAWRGQRTKLQNSALKAADLAISREQGLQTPAAKLGDDIIEAFRLEFNG